MDFDGPLRMLVGQIIDDSITSPEISLDSDGAVLFTLANLGTIRLVLNEQGSVNLSVIDGEQEAVEQQLLQAALYLLLLKSLTQQLPLTPTLTKEKLETRSNLVTQFSVGSVTMDQIEKLAQAHHPGRTTIVRIFNQMKRFNFIDKAKYIERDDLNTNRSKHVAFKRSFLVFLLKTSTFEDFVDEIGRIPEVGVKSFEYLQEVAKWVFEEIYKEPIPNDQI